MSYLSLQHRVSEAAAIDPGILAWLYSMIARAPLVRTAYRHFLNGVLSQGVTEGWGLDLGTGPGFVAMEIARRRPGLHMIGLDLAAHMVKRATAEGGREVRRNQASRAGIDRRGSWLQADGHRLPFADHSFQLVISSFALHHWGDPLRILDEIARVLAPGGRYYVADVCRELNPIQRMLAYASIPAISLPFGSYRGYGGYYESVRAGYTREEARALLKQCALPSGEVGFDSTWFVPILTIASKGTRP